MTSVPAALASVALAALVAVAALTGTPVMLAAAVGFVVLVLAIGWGTLLDLPAPTGSAVVVTLVGWACAALGLRVAGVVRPLAPFAALLAGGVLLAFLHELTRRRGRPRLVESVGGTVSGLTLALLGGGWMLLPHTVFGNSSVVTAAVTVAAARLATLAVLGGVGEAWLGWIAFGAGTVAGAAGAFLSDPDQVASLLPVAVGSAAVTAGLGRLVDVTAPGRGVVGGLAAAAAPVLACGTVAFAIVRLVG